jgi:hypothetical protein
VLEQEHGEKAAHWYEIERLSSIVHVEPDYYTQDDDTTCIIQKRYAERYKSLKVVSGLANLPKPEDLKILAVENLGLKIKKEKEIIAAPSVRNWNKNGVILLDRGRKWEALGLALAYKQTSKNLSNLFENLLRAKDGNEVFQRLRDLGVPESAIEDLEGDFRNTVITDGYDTVPPAKKEPVQEENPDEKGRQDDPITEKGLKKADSELEEKRKAASTPGSPMNQSRRDKGEDAENWMRIKIADLLRKTSDWKVSGQPKRDDLGHETDIVLFHPMFGEYHIEVKHVEVGKIFWSEGEVSKAKDHKMKYWMVLVRPGYAEHDQNIIWLWNPLEELKNLPRRGKWIWRTETDDKGVEIKDWDVPTPRNKMDATNFTFVITATDEFLNNLQPETSRGLTCFTEKLCLING